MDYGVILDIIVATFAVYGMLSAIETFALSFNRCERFYIALSIEKEEDLDNICELLHCAKLVAKSNTSIHATPIIASSINYNKEVLALLDQFDVEMYTPIDTRIKDLILEENNSKEETN